MVVAVELRPTQQAVLDLIKKLGPLTDNRILDEWEKFSFYENVPKQSPSGLRTRRCELVDLGLVRASDKNYKLKSGRNAIAWEAV